MHPFTNHDRRGIEVVAHEVLKTGMLCLTTEDSEHSLLGFSSEDHLRQVYGGTGPLRSPKQLWRVSAEHEFDVGQVMIYIKTYYACTGRGENHTFYEMLYKDERIFLNKEPVPA